MPIDRLIQRPVKTLGPNDSCTEAAALMRDENIGAVVVADEGRVLGVVTDRDLVVRVMATGEDPEAVPLRDVMSGSPVFLSAARSLDQVINSMRDLAVRRVPIVDDDGQLKGLVSMDDLLILLADQLGSLATVIRKEIQPSR